MDYLVFNGKKVRVEANWNAIVAFLSARGQDTMEALSQFGKLAPSDMASLLAACINEGERLDGRSANYTAEDIGELCNLETISEFMDIYVRQSKPRLAEDPEKKA